MSGCTCDGFLIELAGGRTYTLDLDMLPRPEPEYSPARTACIAIEPD